MRTRVIGAIIAAAALTVAAPVRADLCTIEATPAATLLLPYFEVDIDHADGVDTFFSINNASASAVLTHVIVWTDMSVEALDFNVFLTGYDVQTIGMGLIIRDGILPVTGDRESISPTGPFSDYSSGNPNSIDVYPSCASFMPYPTPALDDVYLAHVQSILTGGPSTIYGGRCGGADYGDNIARGYVTADIVVDCTLKTPCDDGYFTITPATQELIGGYGNALWGDWYMIDYANDFAQGDTLVHVEAGLLRIIPPPQGVLTPAQNLAAVRAEIAGRAPDATDAIGFGFGGATFWGRCATVFDEDKVVVDFREPLGTTYAARFYQNAAFSGGTDYLVWRDSLFNVYFGDEDGFSCSSGPDWFPLNERQVVFFDEQENPETACTISPCPEQDILFPLEAQRVSIEDIDVTPESGWTYMNLNQVWIINPFGLTTVAAQGWVTAVHSAEGRFSAGLPAVQLDSMCDFSSVTLGPSGPDFPAEEETYSPFYFGSFTVGAQPAVAGPQATGVKNPLKP